MHREHRGNIQQKLLFLRLRQFFERGRGVCDDLGYGKFRHGQGALILLHAGEYDEVVREICKPLRLLLYVADAFVFARIKLKQIGVRVYYRERSFYFVSRVRDKPFLLLVALGYGAYYLARKEKYGKKRYQKPREGHDYAGEKEVIEGIELSAAIEEYHEGSPFVIGDGEAESADKPFFFAEGKRLLRVFGGGFRRERRRAFRVGADDISVGIGESGEISQLIGKLWRDMRRKLVSGDTARSGKMPLVLQNKVEYIIRF